MSSADTRPFVVPCDWCGVALTGELRRSEVGQMVVVQMAHGDLDGRSCLGSGRAVGGWPLRLELRAVGDGYELEVGGGRPRTYATRVALVASLGELGVDLDIAQRLVAGVEPGRPVHFETLERRQQPRSRGGE